MFSEASVCSQRGQGIGGGEGLGIRGDRVSGKVGYRGGIYLFHLCRV